MTIAIAVDLKDELPDTPAVSDKRKGVGDMLKRKESVMRSVTLFFVLSLVVCAAALGCGVPQEKYDADIAALQGELDKTKGDLNKTIDELRKEKQGLDEKLAGLNEEMDRIAVERDRSAKAAEQAKKRLETFRDMLTKFQAMIKSGKLKIKIVNNKMVVEMASAILFPSGKAELSEEGTQALTEVAKVLSTITDQSFQVAGHTDNVPIKNRRFKSNWELSAARAVAVVKHLMENGVTANNISAAGYAETQPAASNDTEEGKAQNRRIEIVLQPNLDELPDLSALEKML